MSPSRTFREEEGMPCTTSWLIEVHTEPGYPRYPLNAGRALCFSVNSSANSSSSFVDTPGRTIARIFSKAPQTICPAWYIFSSSFGDLQMTISPCRACKNLVQFTTYFFNALGSVYRLKNAVLSVIIRERFRFAIIRRQTFSHDVRAVVRALNQFSAVDITNAWNLRRTLINIVRFAAHAAGP